MEQAVLTDWGKLELLIGEILSAEKVPRTEKLYKLKVAMGEGEVRQIVSSLVPYYTAEELVGKKVVVFANLKPAKFAGEESQGMLLCAESDDGSTCVLLGPQADVPVGTKVT
jgi:methionine--tRNA ligase beta chain